MREVLDTESAGKHRLEPCELVDRDGQIEIQAHDRLGVGVHRLAADHAEPEVVLVEQSREPR